MNAIRHSFSYTVGGDHEWSGVACLRNADGSFTDGFCSRLGFVLCTEGLGAIVESHWTHALSSRRPWRWPLLRGGDAPLPWPLDTGMSVPMDPLDSLGSP